MLCQLARVFGEMYEQGWKPQRTIVFFHWDGEEYNLLGSTDFTDRNGAMISEHMIAYVNIDGIVGNWFPDQLLLSVSASPVLAGVLSDALAKTPSPIAGVSSSSLFDGTFDVLGDGNRKKERKFSCFHLFYFCRLGLLLLHKPPWNRQSVRIRVFGFSSISINSLFLFSQINQ